MKFGSKHIWSALQLLTGVICIWVGAKFTAEVLRYLTFPYQSKAQVVDWGVLEFEHDKFKICVTYEFEVGKENYTSQHLFEAPVFRNRYAAEQKIHDWSEQEWNVWYRNSEQPKSTLVKTFPFKTLVHLVLSVGVLLYFSWLRGYYGIEASEPSKS